MNEFAAILRRLRDPAAYPAVLATLVSVRGSSYRQVGARLLIDSNGRRLGSISGGCLEGDLAERAQRLMAGPHRVERVVYDTTTENDLVWGVGLGCHGVVDLVLEHLTGPPPWLEAAARRLARRESVTLVVGDHGPEAGTRLGEGSGPADRSAFVNTVLPPLALVVFGAGDDAAPLIEIAATLGWTTTVVDPRAAFATAARFPRADRVSCLPAESAVDELDWDARTAAVIMTHHYRFDRPLLQQLAPLGLNYVGLLGPRQRALQLLASLEPERQSGVAPEWLHAPVGLDLGGDGPAAIALAITAEIQARFTGRDARPLRQRTGSIHAA